MPKPDSPSDEKPSDEEPKDELAPPDDHGPSFADLMMLVFSGPLRLDDADEMENKFEAERAAEEVPSGGTKGTEPEEQPQ